MRFDLSGCGAGLDESARGLLELVPWAESLAYDGVWFNEEHFGQGSRVCLSPILLAGGRMADVPIGRFIVGGETDAAAWQAAWPAAEKLPEDALGMAGRAPRPRGGAGTGTPHALARDEVGYLMTGSTPGHAPRG